MAMFNSKLEAIFSYKDEVTKSTVTVFVLGAGKLDRITARENEDT